MYVSVQGRKYWVEDDGEGPVLLLIHGFTGSTRTFDEMVHYFSESFRFIKIDLPGHANTGPIGIISIEECCRDLREILKQMNTGPVNILGYSLGGRTALSFAILHPDWVDNLILESASPGLATTEEQLARQAKDAGLAKKVQAEGVEAFVDFWENISLFETQKNLSSDVKGKLRDERLNQVAEGLAQSLLGMGTGKQPSWWNQLHEVTCPVLLITGEKDSKFHEINKKMDRQLSQSRWRVVESAGHTVHIEKPKIFAKIVVDFMIQ